MDCAACCSAGGSWSLERQSVPCCSSELKAQKHSTHQPVNEPEYDPADSHKSLYWMIWRTNVTDIQIITGYMRNYMMQWKSFYIIFKKFNNNTISGYYCIQIIWCISVLVEQHKHSVRVMDVSICLHYDCALCYMFCRTGICCQPGESAVNQSGDPTCN